MIRVVLVTPLTPWGLMIEDIVGFAVNIASKQGVNIDYKVYYSPSDSRAVLDIDGKQAVFTEGELPELKDIVDLLLISSVPHSIGYSDPVAVEA